MRTCLSACLSVCLGTCLAACLAPSLTASVAHAAQGHAASHAFSTVVFIPFDEHDLGFSEAAYDGYVALRDTGASAALVRNAETLSPERMRAIVDARYARGVRGFIFVGAEFSAVATSSAARHPDAYFATLAGHAQGANVVNYCLDCRQLGGALAGAVAARASATKTVGFVGGVEAVDGSEAQRFKQAVLDASPGAAVRIDWTGAWGDRSGAARLAQQQIRAGADIVVADANDGVFVGASAHPHARVIGWMTDASRRYANTLASVVVDMGVVFRRFVAAASSGRFASGDVVIVESDRVWRVVWPRRP
ncbi:BMP family ABC transporter substrate-binding protein [Pararobbsia silviterrae]|nr:BMP family ABC transporter substrate-binding protein [Pararobbsia silviterrae]